MSESKMLVTMLDLTDGVDDAQPYPGEIILTNGEGLIDTTYTCDTCAEQSNYVFLDEGSGIAICMADCVADLLRRGMVSLRPRAVVMV